MVHKSKEPTRVNELKNEDLNSKNIKLLEEKITGSAAVHFYNLLKNPPIDPKRGKIIKEALYLFPDPNNPTEIDVEL
jgi:hypothetical protein